MAHVESADANSFGVNSVWRGSQNLDAAGSWLEVAAARLDKVGKAKNVRFFLRKLRLNHGQTLSKSFF